MGASLGQLHCFLLQLLLQRVDFLEELDLLLEGFVRLLGEFGLQVTHFDRHDLVLRANAFQERLRVAALVGAEAVTATLQA